MDGWIDWAGGECPVPKGKLFEYRLRDGGTGAPLTSSTAWNWKHEGSPYDIVAYRLIAPPICPNQDNHEAGRPCPYCSDAPSASARERAAAACEPLIHQRSCTGDNIEDPGLILWRRDYNKLVERNACAIEQAEREVRADERDFQMHERHQIWRDARAVYRTTLAERQAIARIARSAAIEEAAQVAERYANHPASGDRNNTTEAFAAGMNHRAGAIDNALCICDAIRALVKPQENPYDPT